jgi:hypothetical protein
VSVYICYKDIYIIPATRIEELTTKGSGQGLIAALGFGFGFRTPSRGRKIGRFSVECVPFDAAHQLLAYNFPIS